MSTPTPISHGPSELSLAMTAIGIAGGALMKALVSAEPYLASISYCVAIVAGVITIYFKFKNKG